MGRRRHSYRTLRERIGRLASVLAGLGVEAGDTVAMMDWDSHRYLECFFAVPMMGAILQTVNVRLTPGADPVHPQPRPGRRGAGERRVLAHPRRHRARASRR